MTAHGRLRDRLGDDRGTTLMELVVGMMIGLIFLGMFTGAIVLLYQNSNRDNALTRSSGQTDLAFAHLDKAVRYAAAISTPGLVGSNWYVEYLTTATGTSVCTQLRANSTTQQLEVRTLTTTGSTTILSGWSPWASGITNGAAAAGSALQPFTLVANGTNVGYEQLTVNLISTSGSPAVTGQTRATFTALNSAKAASAATGVQTVCAMARG